MTRRQPAASHERRITSDPHLNAELARLWADPTPREVPEHGTPQPRTALTDKLDAWLRQLLESAAPERRPLPADQP